MTAQFNAKSTADEVLASIDLRGKRFLITGASSGIGLETARALVSRGANVVGASVGGSLKLSAPWPPFVTRRRKGAVSWT
jgi:hypothetical protein